MLTTGAVSRWATVFLAWLFFCGAAAAQPQEKVPVIGFLTGGTPAVYAHVLEAFRQGLRDFGYEERKNITVHYRFGEGSQARLDEAAAELVHLKVSVIVAAAQGAFAARKATSTVPIVFLSITDPVRFGFVDSLRRPGGNMTGFSYAGIVLNPKRLELLKEALPRATRFAALASSNHSLYPGIVEDLRAAATRLGVHLHIVDVPDPTPAEIDAGFERVSKERPHGVLVLQHANFVREARRIVDLAAKHRIPAMYELREFVEFGGLMSYSGDLRLQFRRAGIYIDKILKGANPAELPVEEPTKFETVLNLKSAKTLGLTIPQSLLLRADEVIQ